MSIENTGVSREFGEEIKPNIQARLGNEDDIPRCVEICNQAWGGIFTANKEMLIDRYEKFPQGFVVGMVDGIVEGYCNFQLSNELGSDKNQLEHINTWNKATGGGRMKQSHNPNGDWIMGVGMAVSKSGSEKGVTKQIVNFGKNYMEKENKKGCYFAIRSCGYEKAVQEKRIKSPEEYSMEQDLEFRLWRRYGFELVKDSQDKPIFFENYVTNSEGVQGDGDPKSKGYAFLIRLDNKNYKNNL
jgi:hypothetical protein